MFGGAVVDAVAEKGPQGHTGQDKKLPVTVSEAEILVLIHQDEQTVYCHETVEQQGLDDPVGERCYLMPHKSRRVNEIHKVGDKSQQNKGTSVFC